MMEEAAVEVVMAAAMMAVATVALTEAVKAVALPVVEATEMAQRAEVTTVAHWEVVAH